MNGIKHNAQRGVGMIEIMLTVVIVGLAVLALGRMIQESAEVSTQSKTRAEALAIAEKQLEALRDFPDFATFNTSVVSSTAAAIDGSNAQFTPSWTVAVSSITDPLTDPVYRRVTVTVAWAGSDGNESVTLTGQLAQEQPAEAGKKLLSLSTGPKPDFDITYPHPDSADYVDPNAPPPDPNAPPPDDPNAPPPDPDLDTDPNADYYINLGGIISIYGGGGSISLESVFVTAAGGQVYSCTTTTLDYSCVLGPINGGSTWSGTMTVVSNRVVCQPPGGSLAIVNASENIDQPIVLANNDNLCPL